MRRRVGIYNVALPTSRLITAATKSIAVLFVPVASELDARGKEQELISIYKAVTKWVLSLALPGFLLMALFSESILMIMFGAEYVGGATALSILAFALIISSVLGPANYVLQTYGKTRIVMKGYFIDAGVNFILNLLLIPLYGINGAAIATGFSFVLVSVIYLVSVWQIGKIQPFRLNHLKPAFASIISVLVVYGLAECIGPTLSVLIFYNLQSLNPLKM